MCIFGKEGGKHLTFPHSWGASWACSGAESNAYVLRGGERAANGGMSGSAGRKTKGEREKPGAPDCGAIAERCYWWGSPLLSPSFHGFVFSLATVGMNY